MIKPREKNISHISKTPKLLWNSPYTTCSFMYAINILPETKWPPCTLKVHKWSIPNVCIRLIKGLQGRTQLLPSVISWITSREHGHPAVVHSRGVWGHAPPGNLGHSEAFWGILRHTEKHTELLEKRLIIKKTIVACWATGTLETICIGSGLYRLL